MKLVAKEFYNNQSETVLQKNSTKIISLFKPSNDFLQKAKAVTQKISKNKKKRWQ